MRTLLRGGRVVDPSQDLDAFLDVLVEDGQVARLHEKIGDAEHTDVVDCSGLIVTPGFIDIHVHLREPGQEYKETVRTGTMAAAAGGFTAVCCMANTVPVNDHRSITEHIRAEAERHGFARVHPIGAVSKGLEGKQLAEIGEMARAGAVAISDDGKPVMDSELMRRALLYARHYDLPLVQHAEDLSLSSGGVMHEGDVSAVLGMPGIPAAAEDVMVARDLILVEDTGGRYHVAHLSTGRSLDMVKAARARGLAATCEVSPHHLLLTDEEIATTGFSTACKMKPPLRSKADRDLLVAGLADGSIDCIASDHAPHHADEKLESFHNAPFGIVGLETTVPLCLDRLVRPGLITLSRLVELLACGPARVMGLQTGTLRVGAPADVTLLSLEERFVVEPKAFRSKGRSTPFAGWELQGRAVGTFLEGRRVELGPSPTPARR